MAVLLFLGHFAFSNPVSKKSARQVAINTYIERCDHVVTNLKIDKRFDIKDKSTTLCYIFNFSGPNPGFVIVSAIDAVIPVLGYSFINGYGPEDHPPQFDYFLNSYKEQLLFAIENQVEPESEVISEWARLDIDPAGFSRGAGHQQIGPLIQTTWNQSYPYNELCPGGSYVGCVAVAMGQVMKYWSHPSQGEGSHSYYHSNYGTLSADFGAATYEFENMPHSTTVSNLPIATLLYHCGVAVEMNYSTSGSGASLTGYHGAMNAMQQYFKFDPNMYYDKKSTYSDTTWHEKLFHEIDNYRPMIYTGWDWMSGGAHAWNLDGYELVGDLCHFHMNWGWGGSYNGYFYLDDLTAGNSNYCMGQEAVFNIYPYAANFVNCYPQNADYWTGSTNTSEKTETSLVKGTEPEDGWMMFDISAIPDGAEIYSVLFNGYAYEGYKPDWAITPVITDPLTSLPADLHADIVEEQDEGFYFAEYDNKLNFGLGWRRYMLEGPVNGDMQNALPTDLFTIGIANDRPNPGYKIFFHGWNEANPPFLKVVFAAYGSFEGYVTEYNTGLPIENAFVNIGHLTDTSDAAGYYHFDDVPIGDYEVFVDANGNVNANGHPYFNQTISGVVVTDGGSTQLDIELVWAEIELNPTPINLTVDPGETYDEEFTITNNGPGDLDYTCYVSPPMGELLMDANFEAITGDYLLWGCEFDGAYIWATGTTAYNGDHTLYKFDRNGNLLTTYSQGTSSSKGMKHMAFDGTYLYSYDDNGFYRIDPSGASVETLFTEFPTTPFGFQGLAWVPGLGFVTKYATYDPDYQDFVIFDETGTLTGMLPGTGLSSISDMTYDSISHCLWIAKSFPGYTFMQYSLETLSLTGLSYMVPELEGISYQSARAAYFAADMIEGKTILAGLAYSNTDTKFFALELETWLRMDENASGVVTGESKNLQNVSIKIVPGLMAEASKTADIVVINTAGENDTLPVTINNNFTHGSVSGFITEYGNSTPIPDAMVEIDGYSDVTDSSGFYQIDNIPIGYYPVSISSEQFIDTVFGEIPLPGPPVQYNFQLTWTEMAVTPAMINVNLNPDSELETSFTISNMGCGDLVYNCELVFPDKERSISILVVDRDMSSYEYWGGQYPADEWGFFQAALDENNYSYTYIEVLTPWDDGPDLQTMQQYNQIIWFTGEVSGSDGMSYTDEQNLAAYLDGGGSLFFSSPDYLDQFGYEYGEFYVNPGMFPYDYLGVEYGKCDQWNVFWWNSLEIQGVAGSIMEGLVFDVGCIYEMTDHKIDNFLDHNGIDMFFIDPSGGWDGVCAIQYETETFKTVFSTASIANVEDLQTRAGILERIVTANETYWLEFTENQSGVVSGISKGAKEVGLNINSGGLGLGVYNAEIIVNSNDPDSPLSIPVTLNVTDAATVDLKVFLEGPFVETEMDPVMCQKDLIPLSQPFNKAPWDYDGGESVGSIPNNQIIDWVLVDFRDAPDAASATEATIIKRQAAFLLSDGSVVDLDGASNLMFDETVSNKLFVAIWHCTHLGILSAVETVLSEGKYEYDFSTDPSKVFGGDAGYKQLAGGICGMVAGDANADGIINDADFIIWRENAGKAGYWPGDFSMDGETNNIDKNNFWYFNREKECQVPE